MEDLPPLPKDSLAKVSLTAFFDLDFTRAVNHHRGADGSDQRGQKRKARDNLQAIRLLKTCVVEHRVPTPAEQQEIALFYGFGGLPDAFRRPNGKITSGWADVVLELEALTTEEELKSLRASTRNAQYTSDAVVSAIWDTVRQALPKSLHHPEQALQVLEPSVGGGAFLSLAPEDVPMEFLAVEMEPITAAVAKALHPREKIFNAAFQKVQFPQTVDVVVGNPPFGKGKLLDMARPDLTQVSPNTHGYFFAKSLDRLRPGGLAVLVVSRYLLDADMPEHRAFRVWLHNQAELVSAVRLPHTVFSKTAFTDVVCDVVALRKRERPLNVIYEPPSRKMVEDWTKARKSAIREQEGRKATEEELIYPLSEGLPNWILGKAVLAMGPDERGRKGEVPILGNPWYRDHPDHVLGELSIGWGKGLYRAGAPIVLPLPEFQDIGASLARVLQSDVRPGMLEDLDRTITKKEPKFPVLSAEDMGPRVTPYSFFVVPERARKAALEIWNQREPNPDGRIPAPPASRLFNAEDQPLIGIRLPDRMNFLIRETETAWKLVTFAPSKAASEIQRMAGMIGLRDTLLELTDLQRTEVRRQTPEMQSLRRKLRQDYDRFVKRYHALHRPANTSLMRDDPSWAMLSGLEIEYTPEVSRDKSRRLGIPRSPERVVRSEIFERRTQYPVQPVEHVDTAVDAMMVSLSESGRVDPDRLQSLTGKPLAEIRRELKIGQEDTLAFIAPDGHWEERSQWLSGNIDQKIRTLRNAQAQSKTPDAWTRDIRILESHRPPRISILERTIHIGAFWLPESVVSDFVTHLGGLQPQVHKNSITGEWSVKCQGRPPEYSTDHMSLSDLLQALHNHRTIQVMDKVDGKVVVDAEATSLAVEKGERIRNAWRDWIFADPDRAGMLEDRYNDLMNTNRQRFFDGRHLRLPGSNPDIHLRPHQKNAVWRMMQSKSTLLDHVVGAGKTFAAIAGVMEKRRTGQAQKPLVVVPNHLVGQWTKDWLRLYPDARLLVADKDDMAGSRRQIFLAKAAFNDVDAVIVAHSSFDRIPIDADFYEQYLKREMDQAEDFLRSQFSVEGLSVKRMEHRVQALRDRIARLHAQANESRDQGCLNFSEIGFDLLVVDESHNYKNVPYNTTLQNVRGLGNPAGSIKAENMMIKVSQCRDGGSGVVFLTGTPISNTVAEMYLLQKYMAPEKLEEKGIHTFDAWVSLFAQVEEEFAFTLTGSFKSLRTLSTFDNLPELVGMYREYADVINQKDIAQLLKEQGQRAIPMPRIKGGKAEIVVCPMTPAQRRMIGEETGYDDLTGEPRYEEGSILYRLDHLPRRPGPGEDNVLVIISDLRKAGLDARAFDPSYVPEAGEETGKLGVCAENIQRIYHEWNEDRGTQLVFLDFSTPSKRNQKEQDALEKQLAKIVAGEHPGATEKEKQDAESALEKLLDKYTRDEIQEARAEWMRVGASQGAGSPQGFVAYEDLRDRLVHLGIPREEIAFIHDADTDEKKEDLFDAVRAGKVRVLIGSTPKMGPGMNVQDRMVHVHHLDAPYRSTDIEQRNGRLIRQGNLLLKKYGKAFRVGISYYVTENSSDAGLWQILETKKKFIDQVRYYDGKSNRVSDPDAQAIDPAAIKAQASGHEVLMLEVPLRARLRRLEALKRGYREEQQRAVQQANMAREKLLELTKILPVVPEVTAQIQSLKKALATKSLADGSLVDGSAAHGESAAHGSPSQGTSLPPAGLPSARLRGRIPTDEELEDADFNLLLDGSGKKDPQFIPWGQAGRERLVSKKFLMDKFNHTMQKLNGQLESSRERVGFIGGFAVDLEQPFLNGNMTIDLYPPDARHIYALHLQSTTFHPQKNVDFFARLENMLDASALESSIRDKKQDYQATIDRGVSDQIFGQEEELQTVQLQHQLASRLLRLKVRKLDGLEDRLTGLFLQDVKKSMQEVQETNPTTGETITVSRLMHSKEQEQEAHEKAKTFVQEMIDAFSRPPLTENALSVLESLGVSAKKREALRNSLGLATEDASAAVETGESEDEEDEALPESRDVEENLPEPMVDETALRSRIGIRETGAAENPWLTESAPFLPDLSAPGNGIQVSLFDDLPLSEEKPPAGAQPLAETPSAGVRHQTVEGKLEVVMEKPENVPIVAEHAPIHEKPDDETTPVGMEARSSVAMPDSIVENQPVLRDIPAAIRGFLSNHQRLATERGLHGEEREYFSDKLRELERIIRDMPQSYQTDGQGDDAPVALHYFLGNADWYIIEKDSDPDGEGQIQAFGLADLGEGFPELGYISIQELVQAGAEMDYHFAPRTLRELKREKYPELLRDVPEAGLQPVDLRSADLQPGAALPGVGPLPSTALPGADLPSVGQQAASPVVALPEIPASVIAIMSETDQSSLTHQLTHADPETVQDIMERLQRLDQWLQHAPDVQNAQELGLRGPLGLMLWNPRNSNEQVFLSGISPDRRLGYGVHLYGEPTEFKAEILSLNSYIGSWALGLDALPVSPLLGANPLQGANPLPGTALPGASLQEVVDARVTPYRRKAWGEQAAIVLKNGINTRWRVLDFVMDGDFPTVSRTEGKQTWTSILMPVTDSDAVLVKSTWGESTYPDLRTAVRETLDALDAPVEELRARMPVAPPESAAHGGPADDSPVAMQSPAEDNLEALKPWDIRNIQRLIRDGQERGVSLGDLSDMLRSDGFNAVMSSDDINRYFHMPVPAGATLMVDGKEYADDLQQVIGIPGGSIAIPEQELFAYLQAETVRAEEDKEDEDVDLSGLPEPVVDQLASNAIEVPDVLGDTVAPQSAQTIFYTGDTPKKEGDTVAHMLRNWGDSGIVAVTDDRVTPYLEMPSKTGSLRVLLTARPEGSQQEAVSEVEYKEPVILATLPDHAVLVAERSYLDAVAALDTRNGLHRPDARQDIPPDVDRLLSEAQREEWQRIFAGTSGSSLAQEVLKAGIHRVAQWLDNPLPRSEAQKQGLDARVVVAWREPDTQRQYFLSGLNADGVSGYGLTVTTDGGAVLGPIHLPALLEREPLLQVEFAPGPLRAVLRDEHIAPEQVRMVANGTERTEKAGLAEMAQEDASYRRDVETIENAGGWDAVQADLALREKVEDQLDHLIQLRAQWVANAYQEMGWIWSGASFSHPDHEGVRIFPNMQQSASGGNAVQWGYRVTVRDKASVAPNARDVVDDMSLTAVLLAREVAGIAAGRLVAETPIHGLDEKVAPLSQVPTEDGAIPSVANASFGTTDPIARAMLAKIEASPYSLPYLLGDDGARDSDDPPYEEDAEWAAARTQFADEIDAVLNARVLANVDALGERGWMQPVLHGDMIRGDAVIHLEPRLNADGDMQGLAYRVSIASDTEGLLTRTVTDVLRDSSARFASKLHGIAEQMQKDFDLVVAEREKALFQELLNHTQKFAANVGFALKNIDVQDTPNHFRETLKKLESDWRAESESTWNDYEPLVPQGGPMANVRELFARSVEGRNAADIQHSALGVLRLAEYLLFRDQESLEKLGQQIDDAGYTETVVRQSAANPVTLEGLYRAVLRWLPDAQVWTEMVNQESLQRTLDNYIVTHIHDHAPLVAQQAKANTLDQFMMGNVLKATSDAILEVIEDQTLPQDMRYAAKAILQGPEGMTDYRAKIARMVFDAERAEPAALEGELPPAAEQKPEAIPPVVSAAVPQDPAIPGTLRTLRMTMLPVISPVPVANVTSIGDQGINGIYQGLDSTHRLICIDDRWYQHPLIDDWINSRIFSGSGWDSSREIFANVSNWRGKTLSMQRGVSDGEVTRGEPVWNVRLDGMHLNTHHEKQLRVMQTTHRFAQQDAENLRDAGGQVTLDLRYKIFVDARFPASDQQTLVMEIDYLSNSENVNRSMKAWLADADGKRVMDVQTKSPPEFTEAHLHDPQALIAFIVHLEDVRKQAQAQIDLRHTQEPLVQAYLRSYVMAADRIEAALKTVNRDDVQDQASAALAYHAVDEVIREVQNEVIEPAADALRAVSPNGRIDEFVQERLRHDTQAQRHGQALRDAQHLRDELFALAKTRTMERGQAALADNHKDTPIEDVAIAIFNKHGIETTETPRIVRLVQNRDVDGIQSAIGHNSQNPASQEVFEHMTGIRLGKTQKTRVRQIDEWAGITPEQRDAMDADRAAQRNARDALRAIKASWESLKHLRMRQGNDGQDFVLNAVKEGYIQAVSYKKGASTQYGLNNPETQSIWYIQRNPVFNGFCKAVLKMDPTGMVMDALQKAELADTPQQTISEPAPEPVTGRDPEIERRLPETSASHAGGSLAGGSLAGDNPLPEAPLPGAALQAASLPGANSLRGANPEAQAETGNAVTITDEMAATTENAENTENAGALTVETEMSSERFPDPEDDIGNDDEDTDFAEDDPDSAPVTASEKPDLPGWKVDQPDMLSPLWNLQIPSTWPNEHGVFPPAYRAEWAHGKGYFDKVEIGIARDPQGHYRFSTGGVGSSYLPSVHTPAFATFLEAHTAAREEVAEKLRKHYASSSAERGFVHAAPKLLEGMTRHADGDLHSLAEADELLQQPPYQDVFHEILEHLEGNQRMVLFWSHWNERNVRPTWMVTLHRDADEQAVVAELRESDQWDFERAPEYAHVVDADNPDAWMDFIRRIADRFPDEDRDALFNAPYGLQQEPVWHFTEPLPAHEIPDQPPAPRWPEDMDHDDLPVESPDDLKNFDRYVGLRFEDGKNHVALLIARDKQGYIPAISYRAKNAFGPSSPNGRNTHYPTFTAAYAQGIKMLKANLKERQKMDWSTGADLAAKNWLDKKAGFVEPVYFGYDAARMETDWDRQDRLEGVTALQLRRKIPSRLSNDVTPDHYTLEGVIPGESRPRHIGSVQSHDRALLLVNTTFAWMGDAAPALEQKNPAAASLTAASLPAAGPLENPEPLQQARKVVDGLQEQFGDLLTSAPSAKPLAPEGKSPLQGANPLPGATPLLHPAEQVAEAARKPVERPQSREGERPASVSFGEILSRKLSDAAAASRLDAMFGSDEALGVRFVDHQGNQIPMTKDADGQSVFPDDSSAILCTNYAEQVKKHLPGHDVQIVGFVNEDNPDCTAVREGWHPGGHDFAMVDHRWLVDPWARLVAAVRDQIVYDLQDSEDARKVADTYGDPLKWSLSGTSSIGHESGLDRWDRTGLEPVIDAYESMRRKAAGITITKAAIIPTRAGVVAVPKEENLPEQMDSAPVPTEGTIHSQDALAPQTSKAAVPDPVADQDWQRLKDLRIPEAAITDGSAKNAEDAKDVKKDADRRFLLEHLVERGIFLRLSQEPSSVNYVTGVLESGELWGAEVQAWSVSRRDLVAQDAELRELRFYNGDPESRHVFLLVDDRFLFDPWMAMNKPGMPYVLDARNPVDRDMLIDRYLSPAFWISPHPSAVLSPAWRELERWNPDLQAFTDAGDDQSEIITSPPETRNAPAETMASLPETTGSPSETAAQGPELVPESPLPVQSIEDAAGNRVAAPREQEDIMDWKSLSETPEIRPELAGYLQRLAEHPERLPEAGRFWAQSVPQEVLREMMVSLSAEWDLDYWKMAVDFLVNSLSGDPRVTSVDLHLHGREQDAITGLSFLLMHMAESGLYWPGLDTVVLDRNAFLERLESPPSAQESPLRGAALQGANPLQAAAKPEAGQPAAAPLQGAGQQGAGPSQAAGPKEMGPEDRIVKITLLPLDVEQQSWKPESGTVPARWQLVATLQDGWEMPHVLKAGVTYEQAAKAAQERAQKWNAELVDVWASRPVGNLPTGNLWPVSPPPTVLSVAATPGMDAGNPPPAWPTPADPTSARPEPETPAVSPVSQVPQSPIHAGSVEPHAGDQHLAGKTPPAGLPSAGEQIPQSIWQQEVTHPMNMEEQQAMEQIHRFLPNPQHIPEEHQRRWIGQAIVVRDKTLEMMRPYLQRDPVLAEQWQQKNLLSDMIRQAMTVNRTNLQEIATDPTNGAMRMLLRHLPVEPTIDTIRGYVLENTLSQMVLQTMFMEPFHGVMDIMATQRYEFPHHPLVDLHPPLVLFGPDRSARVILMKTPRHVPHMDSADTQMQIHACKSWVSSILQHHFQNERLPIYMHIAYFDAARQNVLIRDVTEIPGQADAMRKQAEMVAGMVANGQIPQKAPRIATKVALTPEITRDVQEIARLEAMKQTLESQIREKEQDLQSRMGGDPESWPKIPSEFSMGSIRTEWSSRIQEDKAMNALSVLGIPRSQVEKPEYDMDGMLRALSQAGIAPERFITGHQLDTERLNAVLQAYGVPRPEYQPARPMVTPSEKHPAYQQAMQTFQSKSPAENPQPSATDAPPAGVQPLAGAQPPAGIQPSAGAQTVDGFTL
ncbi:MAG: SNF2-related protein [Acidithiobacillus sp.]|nr:SNF2-related protein [Acidithiobacillus sp.]